LTTFTGTIPTIASGDTTTVPTNLATYRDALKAASEAWSTWTPTYTGITAIGNATVVARYSQIGKWVHGHFMLTVGSTTTFGVAFLTASLPVAVRDSGCTLGTAYMEDVSASARQPAVALEVGGAARLLGSGSSSFVSNTVPWTWATGDLLRFEFQYEAA